MQRIHKELGDYRLLATLAKGGQSEVFLAARNGPHGFFRPVVIKAIPDEFKGDRRLEGLFYQEATISSRFSHPHVGSIHDARRAGDEHFMVMDYVAGQTVADLAQRAFAGGEGISLEETLLIIADACRGLDYVHSFEDIDRESYQIVHCDISPQNLMVTYSGATRVFDFGISQIIGESGKLKSEIVGGKYAYMSPEQCRGEEVDTRSDIFSLGVILYELITGRRLFRRKTNDEVILAVTEGVITPPSEVADHLDEAIDEVVMHALARDPDERYQSAGELHNALEELLADRQVRVKSLRKKLGKKVATLFSDEREAISETLRDARREMSEQVFAPISAPDEKQAPGPTQREVELEEDLIRTREKLAEIDSKARRSAEVAATLVDEFGRLRKRQKWFVTALVALSVIAMGLALLTFLADQPAVFEESEPGMSAEVD